MFFKNKTTTKQTKNTPKTYKRNSASKLKANKIFHALI